MRNDIFENIIKNSKIAYSKINFTKNKEDKYTGISVIEQNKEFEKVARLVSDNNILSNDAAELLINNWIRRTYTADEFDLLIKDVINNGQARIEYSVELKDKKLIVDIYNLEKYILLIYNLEGDKARSDNKLKSYNWAKDLDGKYIVAYKDYYNYLTEQNEKHRGEIIGKKDIEIWSPEEVKIFREHENEVISKRFLKTYYEIITDKKGRKKYMECTLWPLFDKDNNIIGTRGTSIEINDKLAFEKSMEQNEESFREITKYCESVFIIRDKVRATYVSPSFKNIFEQEPEDLYHDIDKLDEYFRRVELENNYISDEFKFDESNEGIGKVKLDNGKEKWIWYKFLPIKNSKGNITKRIGILTDVTEKKKLEEEKNQLELDFFANLSHELRTPINLISSTIQLIKMKLNKKSPEEIDKLYNYMDIMEINSLRLLKLINSLLDSSRIDAGYVKFDPVSGDIIKFIEDICESTIDFAKVNNMEIIFDTNSEEEIVLFDPDIVERTMLNLLSNAIKFNRINGMIYVNIYIKDDEIKIVVKDEGIGIPKENKHLIFDRFEQVSSRNRAEKQGSGIGLYLVKSLVELHGGSIRVESEINKGSEFVVCLPKLIQKSSEQNMMGNNDFIYAEANVEFSDI
ncbi:MAG: ATP-binding protein [Terrisporobacter sp.]